MCAVILLYRPDHEWPLLLAANRDEMDSRPSDPPGRHWPDRPDVIAGRDRLADGSWLGLNDNGVVAAMLNRQGTLGPQAGKRSRGELVLEALDHADAATAAEALGEIEPSSYRSFNLIVADNRDAYWVRHSGRAIDVRKLPPGLSMITAHDRNDLSSPRIARHLRDFRTVEPPDPSIGDWASWTEILARRALKEPDDGMTIATETGFGTVSSALIALPGIEARHADPELKPIFLYADGRPDEAPYLPIDANGSA
jgi:hypothetical protein